MAENCAKTIAMQKSDVSCVSSQNNEDIVYSQAYGKVTGSDAVIKALIEHGVDVMFGYPGGAIMPVYDAMFDYQDQLKHILVRHEQGASHAAEGFARVSGRPGVCIATSGPGATNLVTGIADAMMDSVPIVCITGQVGSKALGTDAFQETDVVSITIPITKWNYQITCASEIPEVFAKAFKIATTGRPGPVLIDITKDAQLASFDWSKELNARVQKAVSSVERKYLPLAPDIDRIERAAELINNAKRPICLVGHGVMISKAEQLLEEFISKANVPCALTLHGLSILPVTHPMYVGMLGMHGNYGPNLLTNESDLIIAIGMRFDDRVTGNPATYAKGVNVIHIEVDPAEIGKVVDTKIGIVGDARSVLEKLVPLVKPREREEWIERFSACKKEEFEQVIREAVHPENHEQLRMSEVIALLSELTEGNAIVVADVGQHQMMAARYYSFNKSKSWLSSGGLGTMGFAVPAAMGAKVACPDRLVVAIAGDGGFQMTNQEIATLVAEGIDVKMIVLNNSYLGMVRQWQALFFDKRYSSVAMTGPDLVKLADAYGIKGVRIKSRTELRESLKAAIEAPGSALIEVVVENEQNVFPMVEAGASVSAVRLK